MTSRNQRLQKDLIAWRQSQELSLLSTGLSLTDIAERLKVDVSTVSKDIKRMRREAKDRTEDYIDNLPFEHQLSVASITKAHDELWKLYEKESDAKYKKAILDSIGEIIIKKQVLLGDPSQIERALKLVGSLRAKVANQKNNGNENSTASENLDNRAISSEGKM